MSSPTSTTEDKIVHGPIRKAVLEEIKQLSTEAARAQATSLVKYYKTRKLLQGVHKDANGNWTLGENHHIRPKSDGGSDDPENKVVLPVAQHFYVHVLLARAETGTPKENLYKSMVAAFGMTASRSRSVAPEEIEVMRIEAAKAMLGNKHGKGRGLGNSGNPDARGTLGNAGNPDGNPGNSGNSKGYQKKLLSWCNKTGCKREHMPGNCALSPQYWRKKRSRQKKRQREKQAKQKEGKAAKKTFFAKATKN